MDTQLQKTSVQPPDIPGFYYDPEKKKYFRLLPSHQAPTSSFYTSSAVQQQQREKQRQEDQQKEAVRKARLRRHATAIPNPFVRARLGRELGVTSREDERECARNIYAQGLEGQPIFELEPRNNILAFATDRVGNDTMVIFGTSRGDVRYVSIKDKRQGPSVDGLGTALYVFSHAATISISISSQKLILATSMADNSNFGSPYRSSPVLYLTRMPDPGSHEPDTRGISMSLDKFIWTSTASPHAKGDLLLGTSQGPTILLVGEHGIDLKHRHFPTRSDVFAVEFLPKDPFTFLCGSRDGDMRLFDVRVPHNRSEIVVRHGSTITNLRTISEVGVLVNGLHGCAMYDLRFPHPASPSAAFAQATRAVRSYPLATSAHRHMIDLGFDVNRTRGVMAVADQEKSVNLFSIATGEKLDSAVGRYRFQMHSKAIRFDQKEVPEGLFVADGPVLNWYRH